METWLVVLICVGIVLAVVAVGYVIYRWGSGNLKITGMALSISSTVFYAISSLISDKPDEIDAHDVMLALADLAESGSMVLKKHQQGLSFVDAKDEMKGYVRTIVNRFPQLKDKVTDDIIDKEVEAAFFLVGLLPKVNPTVKDK